MMIDKLHFSLLISHFSFLPSHFCLSLSAEAPIGAKKNVFLLLFLLFANVHPSAYKVY